MSRDGRWTNCCTCKSDMWLPTALNEAALAAREQIKFYCAYGHVQFFTKGETDEDKLRRERDRLAQQIAQRDDELKMVRASRDDAEARAAKSHRKVVSMIKRAKAGVCPCCNRTFVALQRHMTAKHPDFKADDSNVVKLKVGGAFQ